MNMKRKKNETKKRKASILIISLTILSAILIMGLSLTLGSIRERKAAISSGRSSVSYQIAEEGVESIMQRLLNSSQSAALSSIFSDCSSGKIIRNAGEGRFEVSFFKNDLSGDEEVASCSDTAGDIRYLKSIGTFKDQKRAVRTPVVFLLDDYTKLLVHSDTTDGSTIFVDSSYSGHTINDNGDVHHETDEAKFGASSIYFDGSGDYLSIPDSDDWDFGTEDFTIDFWLRISTLNTYQVAFYNANSAVNNNFAAILYNTGTVALYLTNVEHSFNGSVPLVNTWYHYAFTRSGTSLRLFINGTQIDSTKTSNQNIPQDGIWIGGRLPAPNYYLNGYIDELRISKDIARWTSDFAPPSAPYGS